MKGRFCLRFKYLDRSSFTKRLGYFNDFRMITFQNESRIRNAEWLYALLCIWFNMGRLQVAHFKVTDAFVQQDINL